MIGMKVEQRQVLDGSAGHKVVLTGIVMEISRAGSPANWSALVMKSDGSLVAMPAEYLTVVEEGLGEPLPTASVSNLTDDELGKLSEVLSAEPGPPTTSAAVQDIGALSEFMVEEFGPAVTSAYATTVDCAIGIMRDLKGELLAVAAERDKAVAELAKKKSKKGDKLADAKPADAKPGGES